MSDQKAQALPAEGERCAYCRSANHTVEECTVPGCRSFRAERDQRANDGNTAGELSFREECDLTCRVLDILKTAAKPDAGYVWTKTRVDIANEIIQAIREIQRARPLPSEREQSEIARLRSIIVTAGIDPDMPIFPGLTPEEQRYTLDEIREAFDAQLVVDARIPAVIEEAFGEYVCNMKARIVGRLVDLHASPHHDTNGENNATR